MGSALIGRRTERAGIQAFMYEPESETEWGSEEAETMEETRLQQDVSEW